MPTQTEQDLHTAEHERRLELPDGRVLSYATYGDLADPLVVVLDGPASRGLARAAAPIAASLGLRLVAPDRPGFGDSTAALQRGIADWPSDHAALLDALGAEQAGIVAQSGGTPYALAAAAALPQRVSAIGLLGALAPLDDPATLAESGGELRAGARLARRAPWLLRLVLRGAARSARKNPQKLARKVAKDAAPADVEQLRDPALWAIHERATAEILGQPLPLAREIGVLSAPWGIDPADVSVPVAFWSGECDVRHPTSHSRRLAAMLGGAPVEVVPGAATFGLLPVYGDALRFAAGR